VLSAGESTLKLIRDCAQRNCLSGGGGMPYEVSWSPYKHFVIVTLPVPSLRKVKKVLFMQQKKACTFPTMTRNERG